MAFFSGTDERDDKNSICYSGVIGKLNTATPEFKFRLNVQDKKYTIEVNDLFGDEQISIPQEWLDKVTVQSFGYSGGNYLGNYRGQGNANASQASLYGFADEDDEDALSAFLSGRGDDFRGLSRAERRAARNIGRRAGISALPAPQESIPSFVNPALRSLTKEEITDSHEPGPDFDGALMVSFPEIFSTLKDLKTDSYKTLDTVALYSLIFGLTEEFYVQDTDVNGNRRVGRYADTTKTGAKDYPFFQIYKEFVIRPYMQRRITTGQPMEFEITRMLNTTLDDAWTLFFSLQMG